MSAESAGAKDAVAAIKTAMETEKRGIEFYLKYAHRTKDETGKNMFILLARDELDHYEVLEQALAREGSGADWAAVEVKRSLVEQVVPKIRERDLRVKGEEGTDQVQALNAALDQERRSVELYRQQMSKSLHPAARSVFQRLVTIEEAHYDIIQAELDSITNSGFWFQVPEFNLEEEPD
jgi:rubrerythrin